MFVRKRRNRTRGPAAAWWSVLVLVLAGAGFGAAPAGAAEPWVPAGPTVALSLQAPALARAGTPFSVTVTALDETGAVATSYRGTVTFVTDDRRAPVLPASYTFTYADRGVHTFTGVELHWAGPRTIAVNDVADPWLSGGAAVLVKAGPLAALAVSAPSRTTVGVPFAVRVSPVDAWKNWVVSYRGTVAFRSDDPAVRKLPAPYTFVAADRGSHTFTGVVLGSTGRFRVIATDTARPTVTGSAPTRVASATG